MSTDTPATPPPGWYPDPAGSPGQRWWNGTTWSESTQPAASPYGAAQPYTPMQSHAQPFASAQPYGSGNQQYSYYGQALKAPLGTNPNTTQAWILALWPLLVLVTNLGFTTVVGVGYGSSYYSNVWTTADGVSIVLSLVLWLGWVSVAYSDSRELRKRGVPQPFGWGWAFIPIAYVIGRSVIVKSRTGRGLAPLFLGIGAVVFTWIANIAYAVFMVMNYYN